MSSRFGIHIWVWASLLWVGCNCGGELVHRDSELRSDPKAIDFGPVGIGTRATLSAELSNPGLTGVELSTPTFTEGSSKGLIAVLNGKSLGPTDSVRVEVVFEPFEEGPVHGTLRIESDASLVNDIDTQGVLIIPVTGQGVAASELVFDPPQLDFGDVLIDTSSTTLTVTLRNNGSKPFPLSGLRLMSAEDLDQFEVEASDVNAVSANGGEVALQVIYTPTRAANAIATLQLSDNLPLSLPIRGRCQPQIRVTPAELDFDLRPVGAVTVSVVMVENIGYAPLEITARPSPSSAPEFSLQQYGLNVPEVMMSLAPSPPNLPPQAGHSKKLFVAFGPKSTSRTYSGQIDLVTNDPLAKNVPVPLSGRSSPCMASTTTATIKVAGDDRYHLYVNDVLIDEPPPPTWGVLHTYQVQLSTDPSVKNVIAVQTDNLWNTGGYDRGMLMDLEYIAQGTTRHLLSDASWKAYGGTQPPDWYTVTYDDAMWNPAVIQSTNGLSTCPWPPILGSSTAHWVWSYVSNLPAAMKTEKETVMFRRGFYLLENGDVSDVPGTCN